MQVATAPRRPTFDEMPPAAEQAFGEALVECSRTLRAYGRSLSGSQHAAEDLVQETLLKAWRARARFEPGTNLQAWTRTILRNLFLTERRRSRFIGEWDDQAADRKLASAATQTTHIELSDVARALDRLSNEQREAVMLFGAEELSIEEIAAVTGVATGTVKSRIGRGRIALKNLLEHDQALGTRTAAAKARTPTVHSARVETRRLPASQPKRQSR